MPFIGASVYSSLFHSDTDSAYKTVLDNLFYFSGVMGLSPRDDSSGELFAEYFFRQHDFEEH